MRLAGVVLWFALVACRTTRSVPEREQPLDQCLGVDRHPSPGAIADAYAMVLRNEPDAAAVLCVQRDIECQGKPEWREVGGGEIGRRNCSKDHLVLSVAECRGDREREPCGYAVFDTRAMRLLSYVPAIDRFTPELVGEQLVVRTRAGFEIRSGPALDIVFAAPVRPVAVAPDGRTWLVVRGTKVNAELGVAHAPDWTSEAWVPVAPEHAERPVQAAFLAGAAVAVFDVLSRRSAFVIDTARVKELAHGLVAVDPANERAIAAQITDDGTAVDIVLVHASGKAERQRVQLPAETPRDNVASAIHADVYVFESQSPKHGIRLDVFSLRPFKLLRTIHPFRDVSYYNPDLRFVGDVLLVVAVDATQSQKVRYQFATVDPTRGKSLAGGEAAVVEPAFEHDGPRVALGTPEDGQPAGALVIASDGTATRVTSARAQSMTPYEALPTFRTRASEVYECDATAYAVASAQMRSLDGLLFPARAARCPVIPPR